MAYGPAACIVVSATLLITAWFAVGLRLYSRIILLSGPFADDMFAIFSMAIYTVFVIIFIYGVARCGLGLHSSEISEQTGVDGMKIILISQLLYVTGTLFVKISFVLTLYRIVQTKVHRCVLHVVMATGFVITVAEFFWVLFACHPISMFWQQYGSNKPVKSCSSLSSLQAMGISHACWILVADLLLGLVIPMLLLNGLQMSLLTKLSVLVLLAIGSLTIIATAIRLPYLSRVTLNEPLYSNTSAILWSLIELSISISSTAAATWKPVMMKLGIIMSTGDVSTSYGDSIPLPQRSCHKRPHIAVHPNPTRYNDIERSVSREGII